MCSDTTPRLSIIIACYNTASSVGKCLRLLEPLALKNVEIIITDDCSTDTTASVIESELNSSTMLKRVTSFTRNPVNLGLAGTHLDAFKKARGEYMVTVDSDDFVDPDALADALDLAESTGADCVASPIIEHRNGKMTVICPGNLADPNDLDIHFVNFSLCNKLIRRRIITDHSLFPVPGLNRWADVSISARVLSFRPKIVTTQRPWYNYIIESTRPTLSTFNREQTVSQRVGVTLVVENCLRDNGLAKEFEPFISTLKFYAKANLLRGPKKEFRRWTETFPEINSRIMSLKKIPLHYRLLYSTIAAIFG